MPTARVATWNLERKTPTAPLGQVQLDVLTRLEADVLVLTETRTTFALGDGHTVWSEAPRGGRFAADERKVLLWSRHPWTDVDHDGPDGIDRSRFVSATTETPLGPICVVGVCIPWHMAEVTHPIDVKRRPWELHIDFCRRLEAWLPQTDDPVLVAGDFNQRIPRPPRSSIAAADALAAAFASTTILTAGTLAGCERQGVDHLAIGGPLRSERVWGWTNVVEGRRLSDHDGAAADLA